MQNIRNKYETKYVENDSISRCFTQTHTEEITKLLMELEHIFTTVVLVNLDCPDEKT